ncbi:EthD domain-containing protein [Croceicoccus sp. YJ47]|uniref:EthD domain-containing protein n=1 Tax=Croceicoccus sp. YJ47 TaxID=2798724 RepID=UPI001920F147|nr:EthD domain-containing protein [Croceicoccus sp. YJ47]QQN75319.1 EthD domain-containing protein [Croceicoccus sp. YJ47]
MSVRIMVIARKKAGLSDEEFRAYYSNRHLPYMHDLMDHGAAVHRRHFIVHPDGEERADYDVISEAIHEDMDTLAATVAELSDPRKRRLREEDESHFLDPASISIFAVETEETVFRPLEAGL